MMHAVPLLAPRIQDGDHIGVVGVISAGLHLGSQAGHADARGRPKDAPRRKPVDATGEGVPHPPPRLTSRVPNPPLDDGRGPIFAAQPRRVPDPVAIGFVSGTEFATFVTPNARVGS